MIDILLAAYEDTNKEKRGFLRGFAAGFKKSSWIMKLSFIFYMVGVAVILTMVFLKNTQAAAIVEVIYIFGILLFTVIAEKDKRIRWKENIENYNQKLDKLAILLKRKEFSLYEKNKIKQLINKYGKSIEKIENHEERNNEKTAEFVKTYAFPLVAFAAGNISGGWSEEETITAALLIFILIVAGKLTIYGLRTLYNDLTGNWNEKKKDFVNMLQDLLDRDFPIEDTDLLEE